MTEKASVYAVEFSGVDFGGTDWYLTPEKANSRFESLSADTIFLEYSLARFNVSVSAETNHAIITEIVDNTAWQKEYTPLRTRPAINLKGTTE